MASAQQQTINVSTKASLEIQVKNFNTINFGGIDIPRFNGSAIDAFEYIQQIRLLAETCSWPTGINGSNPEGNHLTGGATVQINLWNTKANWNCTTFTARAEAAAGNHGAGLGRPPALANQSWANLDLDGYTIADGITTTASDDYAAARVSAPVLIGRFAAANGTTTNQHQPINDQRRARQIVNKLASRFQDLARQKWNSTPENERPRCFEDLQWEGQVTRADGKYGFYSWIMRNFIAEAFKTAKYKELQTLTYLNYPEKRSRITGQIEPKNMPDFISYWKMALEISEMDFGALQNQRQEFMRRIPSAIVQEIERWMGNGHMNPTMDEIYTQAQNHEVMMTDANFYLDVAPLTKRHQRGRKGYGINNLTMEKMIYGPNKERNINNLCIQQYEEDLNELNNVTGTFKTDQQCFNCGKTGHWMRDCPSKNYKNTKSMNRSRNKNTKGKERINRSRERSRERSQNYHSTKIYPYRGNQYTDNKITQESHGLSSRVKAINRYHKSRERTRSQSRSRSNSRSRSRSRDNKGRFVKEASNINYRRNRYINNIEQDDNYKNNYRYDDHDESDDYEEELHDQHETQYSDNDDIEDIYESYNQAEDYQSDYDD